MQLGYSSVGPNAQAMRLGGRAAIVRLVWLSIAYSSCLFLLAVLCGILDQPHLVYASANWLTYRISQSAQLSALFTAPFVVVLTMSVAVDFGRHRSVDGTSLPSLTGLGPMLRTTRSRLLLAAGTLSIAGYIVLTEIEYWEQRHLPNGVVRPPERFFLAGVWLFAVAWLAETVASPVRTAWAASACYLCVSLVLGYPMCQAWLRE